MTQNENQMLFEGVDNDQYYWLGSRFALADPRYVLYKVEFVRPENVDFWTLFDSEGTGREVSRGVRPVVSLRSDVKIDGDGTTGWIIE